MAESQIARIPSRWVTPIWVVVTALVVFQLVVIASAVPYRIAELETVCTTPVCEPLNVTEADVAVLEDLNLSLRFYAVWLVLQEAIPLGVIAFVVGLLVWKARDSWVAVVAVFSFFWVPIAITAPWAQASGSPWVTPYNTVYALNSVFIYLLIAIFPNGTFRPKWVRTVLFVALPIQVFISAVAPLYTTDTPDLVLVLGGIMIIGQLVLVTGVQIHRYRKHYTTQQRQQTRWLVLSMLLLIPSTLAWFVFVETNLRDGNLIPHGVPFLVLTMVGVALINAFTLLPIPVAITVAILRYRLWNVDIIIRRTLQYGAVSAILAAVYFGTVVLLQSAFRGVVGTDSPVIIVISTLLIAALFNPVRGRVQRIVDRRFYRQRYDAQQILADFSSAMRDEVALGQIEHELLTTVSTTLEPEHVSLWIVTEQQSS